MNRDLILILDFGGNQAYYTARKLRGEQFYCEILPQLKKSPRVRPAAF